jgi:hypothetical protein
MVLENDEVNEQSLSSARSARIGGTDTLFTSRVGSGRRTCIRIRGYGGIANPVNQILDINGRYHIRRKAQSHLYVVIMLLQRRKFNFEGVRADLLSLS